MGMARSAGLLLAASALISIVGTLALVLITGYQQ
jgi:hypothetical protein